METNDGGSPAAPASFRLSYPLHRLVAAVAPESLDQATAALAEAGIGPDQIDVVTSADVSGLDGPMGGTGFRSFLTRFQLSLGDDLDALEQARQELQSGHTLIMVLVHNDEERDRAEEALRTHGGHAMRYFGRWSVTSYEDGDQ
jgi:hypothetical protein